MSQQPGEADDRENRLEQVLAQYLLATDAGEPIDEESLVRQHPDLSDELRSFFRNRTALNRLAGALKGSADASTAGLDDPMSHGVLPLIRYFGDYELLEELGRGGMGVVFKARQTTLNRPVALKMILSGLLASTDDVQRFKQEAEAAANLDHPHIAPIYETGEHDGQHYFSMKLIEGRSLRQVIAELRNDPQAQRRGVVLLVQVARAVHHAHQRGVLHRDLKPANILIDHEGTPYVTDFGLAKRVEGGSDMTQTGAIVGTPSYMAPEQAAGKKQLTTAVDVYSLGAILYEVLTGVPPFRADSPLETLLEVVSRDPARPSAVASDVDRDLETIALKCLEKDPARRYDSAAALADELDRWLQGVPIVARPGTAVEKIAKWARRRPAVAGLGAVTLVAALALVAVILVSNVRLEEQRNYAERQEQLAAEERDKAVVARNEAEKHRLRTEELLSLAQAREGVNRLEQGDASGLLNLLESRRTVQAMERLHWARAGLWAAWYPSANRLRQVLPGSNLGQVAFAPDGQTLATRGPGNRITIWNATTGQAVTAIESQEPVEGLHQAPALVFTADGRAILSITGFETRAELWDIATKKLIAGPIDLGPRDAARAWISPGAKYLAMRVDGHALRVRELLTNQDVGKKIEPPEIVAAAALSADGQLLATAGVAVQLWDVAKGEARGPATPLVGDRLKHVLFSPNGKWYAVVSDKIFESMIQVFDAATGQPHGVAWQHAGIQMPGSVVDIVKFSSDGSMLATMSKENLQLWDVETGKLRGKPMSAESLLYDFAFSPNDQWLAVASGDGHVRVWNTAAAEPSSEVFEHREPVWKVVFSPNSRLLATGAGGIVRLWQTAPADDHLPPVLEHAMVSAAAFSPQGKLLATAEPLAIRFWNSDTGKPLRAPIELSDFVALQIQFSANGKRLAAATEHDVHVWDTTDWQPLHAKLTCEDGIEGLAVSHDGQRVAALVRDGLFRVWNTTNGKPFEPPLQQEPMQSGFFDPMFTPDGKLLAARGSFGMVVVDLAKGERIVPPLKPLTTPPEDHRILWAMSPDGRWRVERGEGALRLYNVVSNTADAVIPMPSLFFQLAFSVECDAVATAFEDGSVRVWDATDGAPKGPTISLNCGMPQIVFQPGGKRIATFSPDGSIRLWEVATGLPFGPPWHQPGEFATIKFSPDGNRLLAMSLTESLRLWPLPSEKVSLREIELRTWLALGMRLDAQGVSETIPGEEWQTLKRELAALPQTDP